MKCEARQGRKTVPSSRVKGPLYCPISAKLAADVENVDGVQHVMNESPRCNARRDMNVKPVRT
jgi:hypothetical protein